MKEVEVVAVLIKANKPNANGDVFTEEALRKAARTNSETLRYNEETKELQWFGSLPMPPKHLVVQRNL